MNINIKIVGDAAFNKRAMNLKRYAIQVKQNAGQLAFRPVALQKAVKVAQVAYKYPPPRPNSRYIRTGRLRRSWTYSVNKNTATISNEAQSPKTGVFYPIYVIGQFQTPIHAETGWQKRNETVEQAIIKPIADDIRVQLLSGIKDSANA